MSHDAGAIGVQEELLADGEDGAVDTEHRVTSLELFFDLVFVFALTQATAFLANDPTWDGLLDGLMVLAAVWWAWTGFAWLTNHVDAEAPVERLAILVAMAAMLMVSLAIPDAFGADATLFVAGLALVRLLHLVVYARASRGTDMLGAVGRFAPGVCVSLTLMAVSTGFDGTAQGLIFGVALVIDYLSATAAGDRWRLQSAGHFAERHGLIVIIALGESIVALGLAAYDEPRTFDVLATCVMGIVISAALWWAYFDVAAIVAERRLHEATGAARALMARDSYSYLHFFLIAGIILLALGLKKSLKDVGAPLELVPAFALAAGPALFYLGHMAFRWRNTRSWSRTRPWAIVALLACWPLAHEVSALAALIAITTIQVVLITFETLRYQEARARIRSSLA